MFSNLTGWHFVIILFIILLLFGAPKLPGLAKSVGQSMKIFKSEMKQDGTDSETRTESTDDRASSDDSSTPSTNAPDSSQPSSSDDKPSDNSSTQS